MNLRTRLRRLERSAAAPANDQRHSEGALSPDPPCPPWLDPADWASRGRIARCGEARAAGVLRPDEYLPGMNADERRYMDELAKALAVFGRCHPPEPEDAPGGGP